MSTSIETIDENNRSREVKYQDLPDQCPICHRSINPIVCYAKGVFDGGFIDHSIHSQVVFQCPASFCSDLFIGYYSSGGSSASREPLMFLQNVEPVKPQKKEFSQIICEISKNFVEIYNQSFFAEQQGLHQVCGTGYRKALEFLVKDYSCRENPNVAGEIQKKFLGNVIMENISDARIKTVAERAAWLGNDETHYLRKWGDKDLSDLKTLIELTIRWIEIVELSKGYENEMKQKK